MAATTIGSLALRQLAGPIKVKNKAIIQKEAVTVLY